MSKSFSQTQRNNKCLVEDSPEQTVNAAGRDTELFKAAHSTWVQFIFCLSNIYLFFLAMLNFKIKVDFQTTDWLSARVEFTGSQTDPALPTFGSSLLVWLLMITSLTNLLWTAAGDLLCPMLWHVLKKYSTVGSLRMNVKLLSGCGKNMSFSQY